MTPAPRKRLRIGEVCRLTGLSADTLRYYERIGLLPNVARTPSGIRVYGERDLSRLRFIQRAQKMNFSLDEIGKLLTMREDPQHARHHVRQLTARKLAEVEARLEELTLLRNELKLLVNLCRGAGEGCPIIEGMEDDGGAGSKK
ncbi:heavy metal-responsive transcriptional regulator [Thiohalobacter sp.]|uniref:heavy metal-responsive transcriptional regulator n=1 Tax=Thiohalobacter sp. TaxID=2025948 RepID=UPI0026347D62|nr:heavy metal-responsive transcriptional regulator [Thiohalobacter sp.]